MAGWDENGHPTRAKLEELSLGWLANELWGAGALPVNVDGSAAPNRPPVLGEFFEIDE